MTGTGFGLWFWYRSQPRWARAILFVVVALAVALLFCGGALVRMLRGGGRTRPAAAQAGAELAQQAADAQADAQAADAQAAAIHADVAQENQQLNAAAAASAQRTETEHAQVDRAGSCADVDLVVYGRRTDG